MVGTGRFYTSIPGNKHSLIYSIYTRLTSKHLYNLLITISKAIFQPFVHWNEIEVMSDTRKYFREADKTYLQNSYVFEE